LALEVRNRMVIMSIILLGSALDVQCIRKESVGVERMTGTDGYGFWHKDKKSPHQGVKTPIIITAQDRFYLMWYPIA
jgi:hypothetical protein